MPAGRVLPADLRLSVAASGVAFGLGKSEWDGRSPGLDR